MEENTILGLFVTGIGAFLFILGTLMLLDRALLIMSNLLILIGANILMTPKKFLDFIIQKERLQGTFAFFLGISLVFFKLPLPGILSEVVGAYWLFGGFLPMLWTLILKIPYLTQFIPYLANKKDQLDV